MKILCAATDRGSATACLPILENARPNLNEGYGIKVLADQAAWKVFHDADVPVDDMAIAGLLAGTPSKLNKFAPDIVLVGCSNNRQLEDSVLQYALDRKLPVVAAEFTWGEHQRLPEGVTPNLIVTPDKIGAQLVERHERLGSVPTICSGHPAVNKAARMEVRGSACEYVRHLRSIRGDTQQLILVTGQDLLTTSEIGGLFGECLALSRAASQPPLVIASFHPGFTAPALERMVMRELGRYADCLGMPAADVANTDELATLVDLVVSSFSGTLVTAAQAKVPTVAIWNEAIGREMKRVTGLEHYPPATAGAMLELTEPTSVESIFSAAAKLAEHRDKLIVPGPNGWAGRVVEAMVKLAG